MSIQETPQYDNVIEYPGRIPPQALEVEEAILGSLLMDEAAVSKVIDYLDDTCFYKEAHRLIYAAMRELYQKSEPIDAITVSEQLRKNSQLERVGGTFYVTGLSQKVPSSSNVTHYAKIVLDKSRLRKLISLGGQITSMAFQETEDVDVLIDTVEQQVFKISQDKSKQGFIPLKPVLHLAFDQIEAFHNKPGGITGVPAGYRGLDRMTSGFQNSELTIIAGRPSMGKTALVLNIARNVAVGYDKPVGFFSLEMSTVQLVMRLLCAEAEVDASKVRNGTLPSNDWSKLSICVGKLDRAPIFIDDTPGLTILDIRARARRLKSEKNIELLVIDYLQLITGLGKANVNRQEEVAQISRSLKALAKELNIPVIALSQLSRAVEQRGNDKRPQLSDLRDSGSIEQDADLVFFVHRDGYYNPELERDREVVDAELIIAKQRNGPTGSVPIGFFKKYTKFVEREEHRTEPNTSSFREEQAF